MGKRDIPSPNENIAPSTATIMETATPAKKPRIATEERIAVAGRVSSVRLQNFMCHSNLQIDFNTKENNCFYIGGPNGSGKSALFAAINLGLGGRGSDNDRGNTVKSYIKDGTTQSKITITLTNEGLNAHPDFDHLISVERTINQTSSTYVMKSIKITSSGNHVEKIISRKKSDVDRIISRFNIHLSNPAFWMSQDRSRSFLANFKPSNVYKLYLESTNLENIRLSYVRFAAALDDCNTIITQKADELMNEHRKLKRMQEQRDLQEKLDSERALIKIYEWKLLFCKVRDYESEIEINKKKQEVHKKLHEEAKTQYNANRIARTKVEQQAQSLTDDVEVQKMEIEENESVFEEKKKKVMALEEKRKEVDRLKKRKKQEMSMVKESIAKAQKEARVIMEKQGNEKLTKKLAEVEDEYNKVSSEREQMEMSGDADKFKDKLELIEEEYKKKENERYEVQRDIGNLKRKVEKDQERLKRSKAMKKDTINKFGAQMADIISEITRNKARFQNVPKGPLGKFVTLVDSKWAYPVEEVLNNMSNNFLCSTQKDADTLRGIFQHLRISNQDKPTIMVASFRGNAYSNLQEPSNDFPTVYRMIEVSDPDVHNAIIDKTNCEQFILLDDKTEAMELMGSNNPPRDAIKAYTLDGSQAYAGGRNSQYRFYHGKGGRATGLYGSQQTSIDEEAVAKEIEEDKRQIEKLESQDLKQHEATLKELYKEKNATINAIDVFERKMSDLRSREVKTERAMKDLRRELTDAASSEGLESLNDGIEEMQKKIPGIEHEIQQLQSNIDEIMEEMKPAIEERKEAEHSLTQLQGEVRDFSSKTMKLSRELAKFDDEGDLLKVKLDKLKADEGELYHQEAKLKTERDEAAEGVKTATANYPVPPGETDPPDLTDFPITEDARRKVEELQKKLDRAAYGCDMSITHESVKQFKEKLKKRRYFCREIEKVLDSLRQVHEARIKMYPVLKKFTEMKVCDKFQELLEVRGHFIGGLEFDHDKETLNVNVQSSKEKDAMAGRRGDIEGLEEQEEVETSYDDESDDDGRPRKKKAKKPKKKKKARDLKGLSGGERSFVTAALVMSLWEVMEQPFRMMDEFDVFMDMMNRKLVMDLLVRLATKKFPHNQFIFFTPQGIKELKMVDGLQVFEMNKVRD